MSESNKATLTVDLLFSGKIYLQKNPKIKTMAELLFS